MNRVAARSLILTLIGLTIQVLAIPSFAQEGAGSEDARGDGPVRLARFSYVSGEVSWRPDEEGDWSDARDNLPIRQGAQVWTNEGGRAEIQFDDGSLLRVGSSALITLQTLFSDADGEFTQITVREGIATLKLRHERSVFQIDTPFASVNAVGPGRVRIDVGDSVDVTVEQGRATVEGKGDKISMESGDFLALRDANSEFKLRNAPALDDWDRWNEDRDRILAGEPDRPSHRYLPRNIELVAGNLDSYGSWHTVPTYGAVWCPRVIGTGWRPYYYGHWVWVNPFGWTWVSDEPWGWAPYHYGTWVVTSYGWAWVPGPAMQYWSPAVVHFSEYGGRVAWCPLAPGEVRYPAPLALGIRTANWSMFFSIGRAAVYYPTHAGYCEARPFRTVYVNRVVNVTNYYVTNRTVINQNTYISGFTPRNASHAGVTVVETTGFGARGHFARLAASDSTEFFKRGHAIGAPAVGHSPVAGPLAVRPNRESITVTRTFRPAPVPQRALEQTVLSAPLRTDVIRHSAPILPNGAAAARKNPTITVLPDRPIRTRESGQAIENRPSRQLSNPSRNSSGEPVRRPASGNDRAVDTSRPTRTGDHSGDTPAERARRARQSLQNPTGDANSGAARRRSSSDDTATRTPTRRDPGVRERPNPVNPGTTPSTPAGRTPPGRSDTTTPNGTEPRRQPDTTTPIRREVPADRSKPADQLPPRREPTSPPAEPRRPPVNPPDTTRRGENNGRREPSRSNDNGRGNSGQRDSDSGKNKKDDDKNKDKKGRSGGG